MRLRSAIPALALALLPLCAHAAGVCKFRDLTPAFMAFDDATKALPPEKRADLFVTQFAPKYSFFYGKAEFGDAQKLRKASLRLLDPANHEHLAGFPPLTDARFRAVAQAIEPDFIAAQEKFLEVFPDFRCEANVSFGPSFLFFDGNGFTDATGWHMLFGVDTIALLHGPQDMPAFFSHELFHIYHQQILRGKIPKDDTVTWWAMWEEGLATYMSQRMNPALPAQQVLWFPTDIVARMQAPGIEARTAKLMLANLDKSDGIYPLLFQSGHSVQGLPSRAGYYMGYRMAAELGRDHSLEWLAHLQPDAVKVRARMFLEKAAKNG